MAKNVQAPLATMTSSSAINSAIQRKMRRGYRCESPILGNMLIGNGVIRARKGKRWKIF